MNDRLVYAENLKFKYKESNILNIDHSSFEIEKGEVIGIVGPNGAGKTTLCLAMKGIIPHKTGGAWGGELFIKDKSVIDSEISELAKYVSMTFQNPETQIVGTTIEEDLAFAPENFMKKPEEINKKIDELMELVRLPKNYRKRTPFNISGGEKQRLAIASSLISNPDLVILDEPTTELDPVGKLEVIQIVGKLVNKDKNTIVVVEQDLDNLIAFAHRLFVIADGKLILQGNTREVLSHTDQLMKKSINVSDIVRLWYETPLRNKYPVFITKEEAIEAIDKEIQNNSLTLKELKVEAENLPDDKIYAEFKNVSFKYDNDFILKNVHFSIKKGDFIAVLGKNGAGKTTMVKHLNGLLKPTSGDVFIDGINTKSKTVAQLAPKVAYVFQNPDHQLFGQSVLQEIEFGPGNLGWSKEKIKKSVHEAITMCGLEEYINENPLSLERGLKQLLILASVIAMDVDMLVVDEPTTGLSKEYKNRIGNVLEKLNKLGKTIVLVTHDMQFVSQYAKSITVVKDGNIFLNESMRKAFEKEEELRSCYVFPPQITAVAKGVKQHKFKELPVSVEEFIRCMEWKEGKNHE